MQRCDPRRSFRREHTDDDYLKRAWRRLRDGGLANEQCTNGSGHQFGSIFHAKARARALRQLLFIVH
jgi:hypothetical protein